MNKQQKRVQPNWFKINDKWHHCQTITNKDGVSLNYLDGKLQSTTSDLTDKEISEIYNGGKPMTNIEI